MEGFATTVIPETAIVQRIQSMPQPNEFALKEMTSVRSSKMADILVDQGLFETVLVNVITN